MVIESKPELEPLLAELALKKPGSEVSANPDHEVRLRRGT